jgi:hypothetical protein
MNAGKALSLSHDVSYPQTLPEDRPCSGYVEDRGGNLITPMRTAVPKRAFQQQSER